jgi:hypothetical protein
MTTIQELIDRSADYDARKSDYRLAPADMRFTPEGKVIVPAKHGAMPVEPTDWAWGQAFKRVGPAVYGRGSQKGLPADYMLSIPRDMLADNMNGHLARLAGFNRNPWMVRTCDDKARAFLGGAYQTRISNTEVLSRIQGALAEARLPQVEVGAASVNPDGMIVRIGMVTNAHGGYSLGVAATNDETGRGSIRVMPYIKRTSCDNSLVIDDDGGVNQRHTSDPDYVFDRIMLALKNAFKLSAEWLEKFRQTEDMRLPAFSDLIADMAKTYGWSTDQAASVATGTENNRTVFGIINGITWMAHDQTSSPDERLAMEMQAGRILADPDSILGWAARVARQQADKAATKQQAETQAAVQRVLLGRN